MAEAIGKHAGDCDTDKDVRIKSESARKTDLGNAEWWKNTKMCFSSNCRPKGSFKVY